MSPDARTDIADSMASLGRHWIWLLSFGVLTLIAGVAVVAWPGPTVIVIAVLFGIQLIVAGIFQFVAAFAGSDMTGGSGCCAPCWDCLPSWSGCTRCGTC